MEEIKTGEYIAGGLEKTVYADPEDPEKIIGLYRLSNKSAERMKEIFYITKILHLLFPKNIPNIHLGTSEPNMVKKQRIETDEIHGIIQGARERLLETSLRDIARDSRKINDTKDKIYQSGKYKAFLNAVGTLGVSIDEAAINYSFDREGNIIYLDDIDPDKAFHKNKFSEEKFRGAISEISDEATKKLAVHYLERFIELENQRSSKTQGEKKFIPLNQNYSAPKQNTSLRDLLKNLFFRQK